MRDPYILSCRLRALHGVPWPIPASMLTRFIDTDLDDLDLAERAGRDAYWLCLNRIVRRIEANATRSGAV